MIISLQLNTVQFYLENQITKSQQQSPKGALYRKIKTLHL